MTPFPTEKVRAALTGQNPILVEGNQTTQLGNLIKEHTGLEITKKVLRYDGRPFNPLQLARHIKEAI
jgi:2-oxoglutarate ferredoxin oxidoreductase subunit alpha